MKRLEEFESHCSQESFTRDKSMQTLLQYVTDDEAEYGSICESLKRWENSIPGWNELADEAAKVEKLPFIQKVDRVGNSIEKVQIPLETKLIRHRVVESGIFQNSSELEKFSKIYLLSQIGESGVTCPLACTDGLARVIEAKGSEYLKTKYLSKILSSETPLAGAQFVTERTGGSDVGAIEATTVIKNGETFLTGKKWYCSTPEEFYLVAARPEGAQDGTKGLGIYFVPRLIENDEGDQVPNGVEFVRLKDKMGTQSLPTAEINFHNSVAYPIGFEGEGFSNLMTYVLNCSRLHNAANALGMHRRAFLEARNYAEQRVAFGDNIVNYPLIRESLVNLLAHLQGKQVVFFKLLTLIDKNGWVPENQETRYWQRFLINVCKYRTSYEMAERIKEAILVFGANGIINDFSILPRLFRDSMVLETWEGTHNTLCLQIMRDMHRFDLVSRLNREIEGIIEAWPEAVLQDSYKLFVQNFKIGQKIFIPTNLMDAQWCQTHARRFVDHFAGMLEVGELLKAGIEQSSDNLLMAASHLCHQMFSDQFSGFLSPIIDRLDDMGLNFIREEPVNVEMI